MTSGVTSGMTSGAPNGATGGPPGPGPQAGARGGARGGAPAGAPAAQRGGRQVVMFRIGTESFALEAGMVREIIDPIPATRVAGARPHVDRIVNVRGNVVPLADIRARFGMPAAADSPDTRFLVLEVAVAGDPVVVALVADKVFAVTEVDPADCEAVPPVGTTWRPEYIRAIVKAGDDFIIVPELEQILN
ncbi:chemotaxis protein CheW [Methylobacterium sp. C33D]